MCITGQQGFTDSLKFAKGVGQMMYQICSLTNAWCGLKGVGNFKNFVGDLCKDQS